MSTAESPESLPTAAVCERCRAETGRYRRGEPHDDRYCFEMIRRAVVRRDEHCWEELTAIYRDHVLAWCRRAGGTEGDLDELMEAAWVKFWRHYTPVKLAGAGGSTAAALTYLRTCASSAVLDEARRRARNQAREDAAGAQLAAPDSHHVSDLEPADSDAFWALVNGHLRDDRERLLVRLTYELDLRPAEIHHQHPEVFPRVQDVYRLLRNVLDRLRRSKTLPDWLANDDG